MQLSKVSLKANFYGVTSLKFSISCVWSAGMEGSVVTCREFAPPPALKTITGCIMISYCRSVGSSVGC